ncbi:hypothetical protein [Desulfovibrio sp. TomC]|uniref:hypothetical protein n=1 Tax=Desulfovibrio sp. TomC TaxID=1562888 RepID=UPI00057476D8|nr:hypothetical protein [Desulfovibrio sp. TomC]KHK00283.1 hypothetical protein NY78_4295 [Desulfovibrio sp. TomC]
MASHYKQFDRTSLVLEPLAMRQHDLDLSVVRDIVAADSISPDLRQVANDLVRARSKAAGIMMFGAHVIRSGVQRYIIDIMRRGYLTCLATNGASAIHDYELAMIGATTESVARYIQDGRFGLWRETGRLNDIITSSRVAGLGFGEAVGREILEGDYPHKDISIFAEAYRLGIPVTVHVGMGHDIIHEHPNFDAAASGEMSYRDFLIFTECLQKLSHGVIMNFGSQVMAPEIFLKGLAMVRNVSRHVDRRVEEFTTLVCDLHPLPQALGMVPTKDSPLYYFRPWKTMLVRTVTGKGHSYYVRGSHAETIPQLWTALRDSTF